MIQSAKPMRQAKTALKAVLFGVAKPIPTLRQEANAVNSPKQVGNSFRTFRAYAMLDTGFTVSPRRRRPVKKKKY
jgi:hypothetical protein